MSKKITQRDALEAIESAAYWRGTHTQNCVEIRRLRALLKANGIEPDKADVVAAVAKALGAA